MFSFVGGPKRPRKTLTAAVRAAVKKPEGEIAILDKTEGTLYSLTGEPIVLLTPAQSASFKSILGINALCAQGVPFPRRTVVRLIVEMGDTFFDYATQQAQIILEQTRRENGSNLAGGAKNPR